MNYIGNIPEQNIIITDQDRYDYVSPENPTLDVNPSTLYATWLNITSGELFVCRGNVVGLNKWVGQLGTAIGGLPLNGLVYTLGSVVGSVVTDGSGGGHLGDITGTLVGVDDGIEFDGVSYFSFSDSYEMHSYTKDFTIAGSFTLSEILDDVGLVSKVDSAGEKQYSFKMFTNGGAQVDYETSGNDFAVGVLPGSINVLERAYFILSVSSGLVVKLEVNGGYMESLSPAEVLVGSDLLQIGRWGGTYLDFYFKGVLHKLHMYNKELVGVEKSNLAWSLMNS